MREIHNSYPKYYVGTLAKLPQDFIEGIKQFPELRFGTVKESQHDTTAAYIDYYNRIIYMDKEYQNDKGVIAYTLTHELAHFYHYDTNLITGNRVDSRIKQSYNKCHELWRTKYSNLREIMITKGGLDAIHSIFDIYPRLKRISTHQFEEFMYFLVTLDPAVLKNAWLTFGSMEHYAPIKKYMEGRNIPYIEFFCTSFTLYHLRSPLLSLMPEIKRELHIMYSHLFKGDI